MTTDIELLPLPDGYYKHSPPLLYDGQMFLEGQMRAYARANIARAVAPLQAEIERLRAEVESLRTDAERYRWLRDKGDSITVCDWGTDGGWIPLHPENIDTAIDAALKEAAKGAAQ